MFPSSARSVSESKKLCAQLNLPDITTTSVTNQEIDRHVSEANREWLVEELGKLSKVKELRHEDYERKEYLSNKNITEARVKFSERSKMFKCKMSYQNDTSN